MRRLWSVCLRVTLMCAAREAVAQGFANPARSGAIDQQSMLALADAIHEHYRTVDRDSLLDVTFRVQMIQNDWSAARRTLATLRAMRVGRSSSPLAPAINVQYEILAAANGRLSPEGDFATAFGAAFDSVFASLDNRTAALVVNALSVSASFFAGALSRQVAADRDRPSLTLDQALGLVRAYQAAHSYAVMAPLVGKLIAADDERRYLIQRNLLVPVGDGVEICAWIVRPRHATRLPALLEFTIYADTAGTFREARRAASNGYVGVTGFSRGKACSTAAIVPYRYDGADAAALIAWIAKQPWSDGQVGMYSGSYEGFTQWAALKHRPPALKAIMAGATNGPGIDTPSEGNIVWNFIYPWPFYTTDNRMLDDATYFDGDRWAKLNREWYTSGRAYRDLDKIDGKPNPVFDEWLSHPTYDSYWQALIPYRDEFRNISISILETAGYYYGGPGAVLYYFREHYKYNPRAEHYLVIGPWDHPQAQRGVVDALGDTIRFLGGAATDPVSWMSLVSDLRYPWFDYALKGKPKPTFLADRVNYEVVGANEWKHAPSIAAMSNATMRFYFGATRMGSRYPLLRARPARDSAATLVVDLRDRTDVDREVPGSGLTNTQVDTVNSLVFVSDPLTAPTEVAGLFSGHLEFVTNKRDFDFSVQLYELTAKGEYLQLPPYQSRASHVSDLTRRRLLKPGAVERLDFSAIRLVAHRMRAGSRVVMVLGVIKSPGQEINYGTGGVVADETIAEAGPPLQIRWQTSSHIDLPVVR